MIAIRRTVTRYTAITTLCHGLRSRLLFRTTPSAVIAKRVVKANHLLVIKPHRWKFMAVTRARSDERGTTESNQRGNKRCNDYHA